MHEINPSSPLSLMPNAAPTRVVRSEPDNSFHRHVDEEKSAESHERPSTTDPADVADKQPNAAAGTTIHEQALRLDSSGSSLSNTTAGLPGALPLPILPESLTGRDAQLYPQSLRVIGYLSMLGEHGDSSYAMPSVDGHADLQTAAMNVHIDHTGAEGSIVSSEPIASNAETAFSATIAAQGVPRGERNRDGDFAAVAESAGALPAATDVAKRLVRLTGDPRSATLWVRDYRMGTEQSIAMAKEAYRQAQDSGGSIARVVVNGHEVWRAAAGDITNTKGKSHGG